MLDIAEELNRWVEQGRDFAVATVVATNGSSPREPGAALAVDSGGMAIGSVSGGCVEGAVYELCQQALQDGRAVLESFGYSDEDAFAVGLTCGGVIDILVFGTPDSPAGRCSRPRWPPPRVGARRRSRGSRTGRPKSWAVPCSYAPTVRTTARLPVKEASAGTRSWTVRRRARPAPCSTRDAPAPSSSARTARAAAAADAPRRVERPGPPHDRLRRHRAPPRWCASASSWATT